VWTGLEVCVAVTGAVDVRVPLIVAVGLGVLPGERVVAGEGVKEGAWPGVDVLLAVGVPPGVGMGVRLGGGAGVGVGVVVDMGPIASACDSTDVGASVPVGTVVSLSDGLPVTRRAARCSAVSATAPQIQPGTPRAGGAALEADSWSASPSELCCTATTPFPPRGYAGDRTRRYFRS
jgi:hypothetical protein